MNKGSALYSLVFWERKKNTNIWFIETSSTVFWIEWHPYYLASLLILVWRLLCMSTMLFSMTGATSTFRNSSLENTMLNGRIQSNMFPSRSHARCIASTKNWPFCIHPVNTDELSDVKTIFSANIIDYVFTCGRLRSERLLLIFTKSYPFVLLLFWISSRRLLFTRWILRNRLPSSLLLFEELDASCYNAARDELFHTQ